MAIQTDVKYLLKEAEKFIHTCYEELGLSKSKQKSRLAEIEKEINKTGTYTHTTREIEHGAKMAWRNSNCCIGRLLWNTLHVFDGRDVRTAEEAYNKLIDHIKYATNNGKIRSTITVFAPRKDKEDSLRIYNHQLIRYAGYIKGDKVIGDSTSIEFTRMSEQLGWKGEGTPFDILPLVIQDESSTPKLFEIPPEIIKEVQITHPDIKGFNDLNIKWYSVPIISDMRLEIGGISYPMAPFNGWYMGTEIGARNLADDYRYDYLPQIAKLMDLDHTSNRSLWKDKALVELNVAVLHSYHQAGVTLVDHHTAAKQFQVFEEQEKKAGRALTGDWTWLIPPVSPATTHVFHGPYNNEIKTPNYFYQKDPNS